MEDLVAFPLGLVVHHGAGAYAPEDGGHAKLLPGIVTLGSGIRGMCFRGTEEFFFFKNKYMSLSNLQEYVSMVSRGSAKVLTVLEQLAYSLEYPVLYN